ncbi:MAG: hypothetical protein FWG37_03605 [Clostridia bacterium]|nr:hypothetical protein [Clostridia bacterium]
MKKFGSLLLVLMMALGIVSMAGAEGPTVGACVYKFDDTFMTGVRNAMLAAAEGVADLTIADSLNAQATQND